MRKKLRFLIPIIAIALVVGWNNSVRFIGIAPPGYCAFTTSAGSMQLSVDDAIAYADKQWKSKHSFAKATVSCSYWPTKGLDKQRINKIGLTPRAQTLFDAVHKKFGTIPWGGFAPGGVATGHKPGSAHYEGRAIDYFFSKDTKSTKKTSGWQLAQWAVVHAEELNIATVIYDDQIWVRSGSYEGWHHFEPEYGDKTNPTIRHLDHVHIDVM